MSNSSTLEILTYGHDKPGTLGQIDTISTALRAIHKFGSNSACLPTLAVNYIQSAKNEIQRQIENLEQEQADADDHFNKILRQRVNLQKYKEAENVKLEHEQKNSDISKKIQKLQELYNELQRGLEQDREKRLEQTRQEKQAQLEDKKARYRSLVSSINSFRTPDRLINAIRDLFTATDGGTVQERAQSLLNILDKTQEAETLLEQLKAEGADVSDLFSVPELSKDFIEKCSRTEFRLQKLLNTGDVRKREKAKRSSGAKSLQRREMQKRKQNEIAKERLEKEGYL